MLSSCYHKLWKPRISIITFFQNHISNFYSIHHESWWFGRFVITPLICSVKPIAICITNLGSTIKKPLELMMWISAPQFCSETQQIISSSAPWTPLNLWVLGVYAIHGIELSPQNWREFSLSFPINNGIGYY
jgi:hypothetical protein